MTDEPRLELSDGAVRLFSIALKRDADSLLTSNRMLERAIQTAGELPDIDEEEAERLYGKFGLCGPSHDLFSFAAATLSRIESEEFDRTPDGAPRMHKRSDWDHAALLALSQTVCAAGVMRNASNPAISTAVTRWSRRDPLDLQVDLLGNYFGNILQDYFEACEVRRQLPDLPDDIEDRLWSEDARAMAEWVRSVAAPDGRAFVWGTVRVKLDRLATRVFLMDAGEE